MGRVVITGMGAYSCLGKNLEEVRDSLYQGRSGIILSQERKDMGFRSGLTGTVEEPDLKGYLKRRQRVGMAEPGEYAYLATIEALENAGMDQDVIDRNEVGILYGNDSSAKAVIESVDKIREKKDTTLLGSGKIFQSMNSTVTMNLATILKLKGINFTVSGACSSGSHSIGMAYLLIRSGLQKGVIAGGAQELNAYSMGSFDGIGAFSVNEKEPQKASRPFDKNRDGLVPGGGAASLILEDYDIAKERGAPILGEILGYGFSSNGDHISLPNVEGPVRSLEMALKDADIDQKAVDYVNAHATSTFGGDQCEAQAIHQVLGQRHPPVSSTKSMTGHECWMAGASEVVYSMLMMQNSFIAPNINFEEPDEISQNLDIVDRTREAGIEHFLSNSFGFGGTNSTLVVKKLNE